MTEQVREHLQRALDAAVTSDADLDEAEEAFDEFKGRIDDLRVVRGEA
ncbi:hypothetical protein [Halorarum salinum]|uniref:Uncharacterized protein n=1 Tax=Halorarum salinum TaxID=2743089 RepID=A0A7D5QHF5_9EURY|nr:hypothetical protein [Halobaculum salinum]QLG62863.1 hypothetical protein HUG12_14450 [Halobaculum salinum]